MNKHIILYIIILFLTTGCEDEQKQGKKLNIITGQIIDSPKSINFSDYTLTARSIFGTVEKDIANTLLKEDGTFRMEYYSLDNFVGDYLRIAFYPPIPNQAKFEFLIFGESWHKTFYISDSASVVVNLNKNLSKFDTIFLFTNSGRFTVAGPTIDNKLTKLRLTNYFDNIYWKLNNNKGQYITINPTGDPIVDTITLDINP